MKHRADEPLPQEQIDAIATFLLDLAQAQEAGEEAGAQAPRKGGAV